MSSSKTEHYQLHRWETQDEVRRSEFNENFSKLDAIIKGLNVAGAYVGNDAATRTFSLGFTPKAVLVIMQDGLLRGSNDSYGGFAVTGSPGKNTGQSGSPVSIEIVPNGFKVHSVINAATGPHLNLSEKVYHYVAID